MRFTIDRDALANAVERVSRCIAGRSPLPILKCVLLDVQTDLVLHATDLNLGIFLTVQADVAIGGEGAAAVPGSLLLELVKKLPSGKVEVEGVNGSVHFRAGRTKLKLESLPGEEFPASPSLGREVDTVALPQPVLRRVLQRVLRAAATTDDARPVMTGILTLGDDQGLELCATDGRCLAWASQELDEEAPERRFRLVVPAKAYAEVLRSFGDSNETVRLSADPAASFIQFELPQARIFCRLLEGTFPDFNRVVPKSFQRSFRCSRSELRGALERMKLLAQEKDSPGLTVMDFQPDQVALRAYTPQLGDGEDAVAGTLDGPPLRIAFNAGFVLDALATLDTDDAELRLQDESHSAVIRSPGDATSLYVIMPIRLREGFPS